MINDIIDDTIIESLMGGVRMENMVEIYQEEKELKGKRLAAYTEAIQEKVQKDSEQIIKILVEERYRQKKTQQEMADIFY